MSESVEKVEVEIVDPGTPPPCCEAGELIRSAGTSLLLRGVLMVLLGLLLVVNPGESIAMLTRVIGIMLLIAGGIGVAASLSCVGVARLGFIPLRGVRSMALFNSAAIALIGLFSLVAPERANIFWMLMIGLWQLITGLQGLFGGARSPFMWSSALLSVAIGVLLLVAPWTSLLTMVWLFGTLLIAGGLWIGYAGFRMRRF